MEKEYLKKQLGMNLQKIREKRNMTREQLAEKAGISATFLANLECGNKMMSVVTLTSLANALSVSVDALIYGDHFDTRVKNMELLLRNQTPDMISYIEKLMYLSVEYLSGVCYHETDENKDAHKEVQTDGSDG